MTAPEKKTPPRDNLCRSVPFTIIRADKFMDKDGEGLTFEGYGAVFNSATSINSADEGVFNEQIGPGAFRKSLQERTPKFQFDHGHHPMFGSLPMGAINKIHEDERGLFVGARVSSGWFWEPVRVALTPDEDGNTPVDGMSFRFSVVREEWHDREGNPVKPDDVAGILWGRDIGDRGPLLRTLKEVKIVEVGPVVWPAYEGTTAGVRSQVIDLGAIKPEQRKLLAEAVLRIDTADSAPEQERSSDDEPQDTAQAAVEHSDEDTDTPRSTEEAGEHESDSLTETPSGDEVRVTEEDQLFSEALAEVRRVRESTPPMTGVK